MPAARNFLRFPAAVALALWAGSAVAAAETPWQESAASAVRLVAGGAVGDDGSARLAGIEFRLRDGWKTYWRMPGDSGVPPAFDWSASRNVASVEVEFPAPSRFVDAYATTIGYKDEVVFPVVVKPEDPALPVTLRLDLAYAVCSDICLPVRADFALDLPAGVAAEGRALIDSYRDRVPVLGTGARSGIASVTSEGEGAGTRLVIEIAPQVPGTVPEIFVEGPEIFYFGPPEAAPGARDGHLRLSIPVDGASANHPLAGQRLRLTVVNGDRLVDQTVSVR